MPCSRGGDWELHPGDPLSTRPDIAIPYRAGLNCACARQRGLRRCCQQPTELADRYSLVRLLGVLHGLGLFKLAIIAAGIDYLPTHVEQAEGRTPRLSRCLALLRH